MILTPAIDEVEGMQRGGGAAAIEIRAVASGAVGSVFVLAAHRLRVGVGAVQNRPGTLGNLSADARHDERGGGNHQQQLHRSFINFATYLIVVVPLPPLVVDRPSTGMLRSFINFVTSSTDSFL